MPITKPAMAVVGMFAFLNSWNDFLGPLVYLNSETKYTVALGLQYLPALIEVSGI